MLRLVEKKIADKFWCPRTNTEAKELFEFYYILLIEIKKADASKRGTIEEKIKTIEDIFELAKNSGDYSIAIENGKLSLYDLTNRIGSSIDIYTNSELACYYLDS